LGGGGGGTAALHGRVLVDVVEVLLVPPIGDEDRVKQPSPTGDRGPGTVSDGPAGGLMPLTFSRRGTVPPGTIR